MKNVLSADETPHTNKEDVYRYKVNARIIDHLIGQWTYDLLMSFFKIKVTQIKSKFMKNDVETFTSKKSGLFMV